MNDRRYTVAEIDALRAAVTASLRPRRAPSPHEHHFNLPSSGLSIEERVRTYMLAGITAEDVLAADAEERQK